MFKLVGDLNSIQLLRLEIWLFYCVVCLFVCSLVHELSFVEACKKINQQNDNHFDQKQFRTHTKHTDCGSKQQIRISFWIYVEILLFASSALAKIDKQACMTVSSFCWKETVFLWLFLIVHNVFFFTSKVGVVCSHCRRCRCSKWNPWIWCSLCPIGLWTLCPRIPCIENCRTYSNGRKPPKPCWLPFKTNHHTNHCPSDKG